MLAAARHMFAARGYAATSTRDVAQAAGLTHTAIYNHFGSKAKLFTAVFVQVQDRLIAELHRSVAASPDEPPFPRALFEAIEGLRADDPSNVEFLAAMYVEVRRDPELRHVFGSGEEFTIVETLRSMATKSGPSDPRGAPDDAMWFWIAFALGLAQVTTLKDSDAFGSVIASFREQFASSGAIHDQ